MEALNRKTKRKKDFRYVDKNNNGKLFIPPSVDFTVMTVRLDILACHLFCLPVASAKGR